MGKLEKTSKKSATSASKSAKKAGKNAKAVTASALIPAPEKKKPKKK